MLMEERAGVDSLLLLCEAAVPHEYLSQIGNESTIKSESSETAFGPFNRGVSAERSHLLGKRKILSPHHSSSVSRLVPDCPEIYTSIGRFVKNVDVESIPSHLFAAFNAGDMQCLEDIINSVTTDNVLLKTKALELPIMGRNHIISFFEALLDGHPDAYIVSSDVKFVDKSTMVTSINFKGTKALPSEKEHYFMKPRLVDNMDLMRLSHQDVGRLRELEYNLISQHKPIEVEFTGLMTLVFDDMLPVDVKTRPANIVRSQSIDSDLSDGQGYEYPSHIPRKHILPYSTHTHDLNSLKAQKIPSISAPAYIPHSSNGVTSPIRASVPTCRSPFSYRRISQIIFTYSLRSFREAIIIPTPDHLY